jgi:hypothetical protein
MREMGIFRLFPLTGTGIANYIGSLRSSETVQYQPSSEGRNIMTLIKTLTVITAMTCATALFAQEAAPAAPAQKAGAAAGKQGGKGAGFGQWKKNPENIKKFDKDGDGALNEAEKKTAQDAWKKETGRGEGKEGKDGKAGCAECEKKAAAAPVAK